jgi:hypothetical protein
VLQHCTILLLQKTRKPFLHLVGRKCRGDANWIEMTDMNWQDFVMTVMNVQVL